MSWFIEWFENEEVKFSKFLHKLVQIHNPSVPHFTFLYNCNVHNFLK